VTARSISPAATDGFPIAIDALAYAARLHAGQRRDGDGAPFILHLLEVARLLYHAKAPDRLIAAGILHDTIEKTGADADSLEARFGSPIATLVLAVSEDERIIDDEQRKAALRDQVARAGREALTIFAADKISRARELRLGPSRIRPPAHTSLARRHRLAHYRECLRLLEQRLPDSPLVGTLRAELAKVADVAHGQALAGRTPNGGGRA
jgi:(p)ppGpp synthase/HD superfamily hydrolase